MSPKLRAVTIIVLIIQPRMAKSRESLNLHAVTASGSATVGKATALQGLFATHVVIKSGGLGRCPYPAL